MAVLRADLGQFPVQVEHPRGAGPLVEVVNVLGDDVHVIVLLQARDGQVRGVGFRILQLFAALVVEIQHQFPVPVPPLDGGDVVHVILLPQAAGVAEGGEAALGADAGAGQYDEFFHIS